MPIQPKVQKRQVSRRGKRTGEKGGAILLITFNLSHAQMENRSDTVKKPEYRLNVQRCSLKKKEKRRGGGGEFKWPWRYVVPDVQLLGKRDQRHIREENKKRRKLDDRAR